MGTAAIVLAAGAGTRMKSKRPKVVHDMLGKPLVNWVIDTAAAAGVDRQRIMLSMRAPSRISGMNCLLFIRTNESLLFTLFSPLFTL